jgi:hypothetical protein
VFKNNNEQYLKTKETAEEQIEYMLTHNRFLLESALAAIIVVLPSYNLPPRDYIQFYKSNILYNAEQLYNAALVELTNNVKLQAVARSLRVLSQK